MTITFQHRAPGIEKQLKRIGDLMENMTDVINKILANGEVLLQVVQGIERAAELLANHTDPRVQQAHDLLVEQQNALTQARDRQTEIEAAVQQESTESEA